MALGISRVPRYFLHDSPGTALSTATRRISWTKPIMRRDVTTIPVYAVNQIKGWYLGVQFRISAQGSINTLKPWGMGMVNCHVARVCRCVKKKKDEKGYFFLAVQHVAQSSFTICRKGHAFTS